MDFNPYMALTQGNKDAELLKAAKKGHTHTVPLLINANANLDAVDSDGWTALMFSAYRDHIYITQLLINANCNLDLANIDGYTALMLAAEEGHAEIVRLLINANANLDTVDKYGDTALMLAAKMDYIDIVRLLIKAKASFETISNNGLSALSLALLNKCWNTACFLLCTLSEEQIQNALNNFPCVKDDLEKCKVIILNSRKDVYAILRDMIFKPEEEQYLPFPFEIMAKQLVLRFPIWIEEQITKELETAWRHIQQWRQNKNNQNCSKHLSLEYSAGDAVLSDTATSTSSYLSNQTNQFLPSLRGTTEQEQAEKRERDQNDTNTLAQEEPEFKKRRNL